MLDVHSRLKAAREAAGFASATEAAHALKIAPSTYLAYENGQNQPTRQAERLARFFRISLEWLITGKGEMHNRSTAGPREFPVRGTVGAGSAVTTEDADSLAEARESVALPEIDRVFALEVIGESMMPRFLPGEYVLVESIPRPPAELAGEFAIVETADGRFMIKGLRHGRQPGTFDLVSYNGALEEDVCIKVAYRYLGTIATGRANPPLRRKGRR